MIKFHHSRMATLLAVALLASLTVTSSGCYKSRQVHVSGKVTFPDGTPLTVGQICFTDGYYLGRGDFDDQGRYELRMYRKNDGIPRGSYQVYIVSALRFEKDDLGELKEERRYKDEDDERYETLRLGKVAKLVELIDRQYTHPDTSGWLVEVKKKSQFDFVVYPPGKIPEDQQTEAARFQFDKKYQEQKLKENRAARVREALENGEESPAAPPLKPRLVDPRLL